MDLYNFFFLLSFPVKRVEKVSFRRRIFLSESMTVMIGFFYEGGGGGGGGGKKA